MSIHKCKICNNDFYVKPSHEKIGWGIFCSRYCKKFGTRTRKETNCYVCNKVIYKTMSQISRSKSGKYFCGKSCQTKWRNVEYSGKKHLGWKGGQTIYRKIVLKSGLKAECLLCHKVDSRILVVHHIDQDHSNLNIKNLVWLCHNCHYLIHHDKLEKRRFLSFVKPWQNMVTMV